MHQPQRTHRLVDVDRRRSPLLQRIEHFAQQRSVAEAVAGRHLLAESLGGTLVALARLDRDGAYVRPAIVRMPEQSAIVRHETFGPILYVLTWRDLDQAIAMQNAVPQGLSSCIFTDRLREAEQFLSAWGSDCGIANVNIGPSGAEIGGAFGGEKDTGGGRESGSDAWKAFMRRQTQTVNFSTSLLLAQGVRFDV